MDRAYGWGVLPSIYGYFFKLDFSATWKLIKNPLLKKIVILYFSLYATNYDFSGPCDLHWLSKTIWQKTHRMETLRVWYLILVVSMSQEANVTRYPSSHTHPSKRNTLKQWCLILCQRRRRWPNIKTSLFQLEGCCWFSLQDAWWDHSQTLHKTISQGKCREWYNLGKCRENLDFFSGVLTFDVFENILFENVDYFYY